MVTIANIHKNSIQNPTARIKNFKGALPVTSLRKHPFFSGKNSRNLLSALCLMKELAGKRKSEILLELQMVGGGRSAVRHNVLGDAI